METVTETVIVTVAVPVLLNLIDPCVQSDAFVIAAFTPVTVTLTPELTIARGDDVFALNNSPNFTDLPTVYDTEFFIAVNFCTELTVTVVVVGTQQLLSVISIVAVPALVNLIVRCVQSALDSS